MIRATLILAVFILAGCQTENLPYAPATQPAGVAIFADYAILRDKMQVMIDTAGLKVESAEIVRQDGAVVSPQTIQHPAPMPAVDFGYVGGDYVGGGHRAGTTIGVNSSSTGSLKTVVWFPKRDVGDGPWILRVKLLNFDPVDISLAVDPARIVQ